MIALVQRVLHAQVRARAAADAPYETTGAIERGLIVYLGVLRDDSERLAVELARNVATYRVFEDETGRMNRSALETSSAILVVSQFTLAADGRRGRRPSFDRAAAPEAAEPLYERFVQALREQGLAVETGRFGAHMLVSTLGDGPATFLLETRS